MYSQIQACALARRHASNGRNYVDQARSRCTSEYLTKLAAYPERKKDGSALVAQFRKTAFKALGCTRGQGDSEFNRVVLSSKQFSHP